MRPISIDSRGKKGKRNRQKVKDVTKSGMAMLDINSVAAAASAAASSFFPFLLFVDFFCSLDRLLPSFGVSQDVGAAV